MGNYRIPAIGVLVPAMKEQKRTGETSRRRPHFVLENVAITPRKSSTSAGGYSVGRGSVRGREHETSLSERSVVSMRCGA